MAPFPEAPSQTVRAGFSHTAYRWSSCAACTPPEARQSLASGGSSPRQMSYGRARDRPAPPTFGGRKQSWKARDAFARGCWASRPCPHTSGRPGRDQSRAPSLRERCGRSPHRYYGPLGLPPGSRSFHPRLIERVFARRGRPGRASPVPCRAVTACPPPYPGSVLLPSGSPGAVCCLRRDMIGSAAPPFGSYLTRLQGSLDAGPVALLPSKVP